MVKEEVFERIRKEAENYYKHSHHDKSHAERVMRLALKIAENENEAVDVEVLKAAALLHDVARFLEDEGKVEDHAEEGARIAKEILERVGFPPEKIGKVVYCIRVHRFRKGVTPRTNEAKILQDADRLDMLGAIGIARAFARGGWMNVPFYDPSIPPKKVYDGKSSTVINHFYEKVLKIKETLHTKTAKEIGKERHKFVEEFIDRFLKEWRGEL